MNTTTATYSIQVTKPGGHLSFLKDMPTRPKTSKGIKSQNDKLCNGLKNIILTLHLTKLFFSTNAIPSHTN